MLAPPRSHHELLPLIRRTRGTLRSAESCNLELMVGQEECKAWDITHALREKFLQTLTEVVVFLSDFEKCDAPLPPDATISEFFRCFACEDKSVPEYLGSADKALWDRVLAKIQEGVDTMVKPRADAMEVRSEVVGAACAAYKTGNWTKAANVSAEVYHSLPAAAQTLATFAKRLRALGYFPASLGKGQNTEAVLASATLCHVASAMRKYKAVVGKRKSIDVAQDTREEFAAVMSELPAESLPATESLQTIATKLGEEKADVSSKLLAILRRPLTAATAAIRPASEALNFKASIDAVLAKDESEWKTSFLKFARSEETKAFLKAVREYDDRFRVAQHSVGAYLGGIRCVFAECTSWQEEQEMLRGARQMLAILSLLQAMFNAAANKSATITAHLQKVPKTGKFAINAKLAALANRMAT